MFEISERDGTHLDDGGDPIERIGGAVAALADEDRGHWTSHALSQRLVELVAAQERLAAEVLRLPGLWGRQRAWEKETAVPASAGTPPHSLTLTDTDDWRWTSMPGSRSTRHASLTERRNPAWEKSQPPLG